MSMSSKINTLLQNLLPVYQEHNTGSLGKEQYKVFYGS